jgi:hypothetical protein
VRPHSADRRRRTRGHHLPRITNSHPPLTSKSGARERTGFASLARVLDCAAQVPVGRSSFELGPPWTVWVDARLGADHSERPAPGSRVRQGCSRWSSYFRNNPNRRPRRRDDHDHVEEVTNDELLASCENSGLIRGFSAACQPDNRQINQESRRPRTGRRSRTGFSRWSCTTGRELRAISWSSTGDHQEGSPLRESLRRALPRAHPQDADGGTRP